jgi:hypothetical protein
MVCFSKPSRITIRTVSELRLTVAGEQDAERVIGLAVTSELFQRPGRYADSGSDARAGHQRPCRGRHQLRLLATALGGSPSVLGTTLTLDNPNDARPTRQHAYTIVGVMPKGLPGPVEMWMRIFFEPVQWA